MIASNEVRIDNWIGFDDDDTYFKIIGIDDLGFSVKNDTEETWIEHGMFSGISITTETILKAGFERRMFGDKFLDEDERILRYKHFEFTLEYNELRFDTSAVRLEYVHQLQNLYFALTGKELVINL